MKRSVPVPPPIFTILILTFFALTLSFRILIRNGFASIDLENNLYHQAPVFNSTLLRYAAIDLSEAKSKQEIEQLLEGNFDSKGRYRTFASWRRFSIHDVKTSKGVPLLLKSPQFYRYWLNFRMVLHDWAKKRRFQSEIMADLVGSVKGPIDLYNGRSSELNRKYRSCAVVGNSGILLQKGYGGLIDGHEFVIRLNNARIERFEDKVGSKSNISFINSNILHLCSRRQGCFCHPYGANVPIVMYICQPIHFMDYNMCNATHKSPLIVTDPRFDMLCSRIVKYYSLKQFAEVTGKSLDEWASVHDGSLFHYSSGFQAVMLAAGICEKVSIFGFGKSSSAKHHYHTNQKAELHLHDYEAEYDFYRDLVKNPLAIPFISGDFKFPSVVFYK